MLADPSWLASRALMLAHLRTKRVRRAVEASVRVHGHLSPEYVELASAWLYGLEEPDHDGAVPELVTCRRWCEAWAVEGPRSMRPQRAVRRAA